MSMSLDSSISKRSAAIQILVAALCAAVVFMDGFDAQAIGYVAPSLSAAWKLQKGALGPVFGAGLFGLMLGALIFGPVADNIGRKPVIIVERAVVRHLHVADGDRRLARQPVLVAVC